MKKFLSMCLILAMLLGMLAGCTDAPAPTEPETTEATEAPTTEATEPPTQESTQAQAEGPEWAQDGALKILAIGNSYTDDTMEYTYDIATSLGLENVVFCNLYIGGATLDEHVRKARIDSPSYEYRRHFNGKFVNESCTQMSFALQDEDWDYVMLQQASHVAGQADSYAPLTELIEYVRSFVPDAKLIWNMTWAYAPNYVGPNFVPYNNDQMTMYHAITDTAEEVIAPDERFSVLVPTGTAIQNARTSYLGNDLTRDTTHVDYGIGRYIVGLTFVAAVTGQPIEDISFVPDGVDSAMKKVAIEAVNNALADPFQVTQSVYTEKP